MVDKKSTSKQKPKKTTLKKETLKDLSAGRKSKDVKGGSLINCETRHG